MSIVERACFLFLLRLRGTLGAVVPSKSLHLRFFGGELLAEFFGERRSWRCEFARDLNFSFSLRAGEFHQKWKKRVHRQQLKNSKKNIGNGIKPWTKILDPL